MAEFEPKQFGRFYLLEKLAVGGMAEIYKAKTFGAEGFEKLLAIKRILPHCSADKDFITMLIDEAKLSVLLSHANIVQVYDLGKVGDDFFISMEYINGINLRDVLYRGREQLIRMPMEVAVYAISEVCKGLDYAHRKTDANAQPLNIVHRDISPQNVLISYEGEVKIVDFGIAKAAMNISHTMAGILKGKIAYMSPEQALGKSIDYRTDIFSVGIILYECLTGEKLFTGESQFEVLKKIRTTKIDINKLPVEIPKPLQQILVKALAYFPKDRFQSAGDMQIELTKFLYSTYHDFSPHKLAAFVKVLFQDELQRHVQQAALQRRMEAQTSSINLAQGAIQQDIVMRDDVGITVRAPAATKKKPDIAGRPDPMPQQRLAPDEISVPTTATGSIHPKAVGLRIAATMGIIGAVALSAFTYVRFLHPRLFPPPETEPVYGMVSVNSNPPTAALFLNGQDLQQVTPAIIGNLQLNTPYKLRLSKPGYVDLEQTLKLTTTAPVSLALTMIEASGTLAVKSEPAGAAIVIDGKPTGKITPEKITGLSLNTDHRITLSKENYEDYQQTVSLQNDKPQDVIAILTAVSGEVHPKKPETLPLAPQAVTPLPEKPEKIEKPKTPEKPTAKPTPPTLPLPEIPTAAQGPIPETPVPSGELYGEVSVSSVPMGAMVYIDGQATAKTPVTIRKVRRDKGHSVRVVLDGYRPWERSFTFDTTKEKRFHADLQEQ